MLIPARRAEIQQWAQHARGYPGHAITDLLATIEALEAERDGWKAEAMWVAERLAAAAPKLQAAQPPTVERGIALIRELQARRTQMKPTTRLADERQQAESHALDMAIAVLDGSFADKYDRAMHAAGAPEETP